MGSKSSKQNDDTIIDDFLWTHIPMFLEKHCTIQKEHFMDPLQFWIAFQSFLTAEKIKFPKQLNHIDSDWLKYYFHQLDRSKSIYITGAPEYNVLVGVSIQTWPGTFETDVRAGRLDQVREIAFF